MGASLTALLGYDVTDPRSPHSVHVASEADVPAVPPWGHETLHRAVRLADDRGEVVVLDHGRGRLYLADAEALSYRPPGTLGLGRPPALVVGRPGLLRPGGDQFGLAVDPYSPDALDGPPPAWPESDDTDDPDAPTDDADGSDRPEESTASAVDEFDDPGGEDADAASVTVSPAFDVLVPAFDIEEQGEPAAPVERHAVETPTGVGTGTPSG